MEMELGGGLFWSCGPHNQWTVGRTHNPNSYTTGSPRMELWTDGEPLSLTSDLLRNPCSVNCHASHACDAALAMRLCLPGP